MALLRNFSNIKVKFKENIIVFNEYSQKILKLAIGYVRLGEIENSQNHAFSGTELGKKLLFETSSFGIESQFGHSRLKGFYNMGKGVANAFSDTTISDSFFWESISIKE